VDVPRTAPDVPFFAQPAIQKSLERILYLWGIRCAAPSGRRPPVALPTWQLP